MKEPIDFYDGKAAVLRKDLDHEAKRRGLTTDKHFCDLWQEALAKDLRKRAGAKKRKPRPTFPLFEGKKI